MKFGRTTLSACSLLLLGGCSLFGTAGGGLLSGGAFGRDASKEVEAAIKAKDVAALQAICNDESLGDPKSSSVPMNASSSDQARIQSNRRARGEACHEVEALKADNDGDCASVVQRYESAPRRSGDSGVDHYLRWGRRMAKCGAYQGLFEKIAHVGDYSERAEGVKVLIALEGEGIPVLDGFKKYAAANQGPRFLPIEHSGYAMNHIGNWLLKQNHLGLCDVMIKAVANASPEVRARSLYYLNQSKCGKPGMAVAMSLLTADDWNQRRLACANLEDMGDPSVIAKLSILANTDPANRVEERAGNDGRVYGMKVYPVRDACQAAIGKIQLRH